MRLSDVVGNSKMNGKSNFKSKDWSIFKNE